MYTDISRSTDTDLVMLHIGNPTQYWDQGYRSLSVNYEQLGLTLWM